jgi:hypothetical protein
MAYDNIGRFLKETALLESEDLFVAVSSEDYGIARFAHLQPGFATRIAELVYPGAAPVRVLLWGECTWDQQRQASHKPVWGLLYARKLLQTGRIPMPASPPLSNGVVTVGQVIPKRRYAPPILRPPLAAAPPPRPPRKIVLSKKTEGSVPKPTSPIRRLQEHFDKQVNAVPKVRSAAAGGGQ